MRGRERIRSRWSALVQDEVVTPASEPSRADYLKWRPLSVALRLAAEAQQRPLAERPEVYESLASMSLFSHVMPEDSTQRRGAFIARNLVSAVRRLRQRALPASARSFDRQALICWYLRVVDGRMSDRAVAEAVGNSESGYLETSWGGSRESRQATVRARMWTDPTAYKSATKGAWPGIARLMNEVEERLGPFTVANLQDAREFEGRLSEAAPIESIEAIAEIREGTRRSNRRDLRQEDLRILSWHHQIQIDRFGNSNSTIRMRLMGKQEGPVDHIDLPIYYDGRARPIAESRSGRQKVWRQIPADWEADPGGFYKFPIDPPLENGRETTLHVKYRLSDVYAEGREWFEWYFSREQASYDISISVSPEWLISGVSVSSPEGTTRELPQPEERADGFDWHFRYPEIGHRYRLEWEMRSSRTK